MNETRLLRIANRINQLLLRELGQGIDVRRLIKEPLYARDVLLVCAADPGSDLDSLARHFRLALAEPVDEHGLPSTFGPDSVASTGFGNTRSGAESGPGTLRPIPDSIAGTLEQTPAPARKSWFSRVRRLGR
ncbi:MAG: hypothetical protein KGL43_21075 [Burkholderiales bacterium]|nr:hypothetical protein [Burkholderiales bacterium]MDE2395340.1 hypothetical protein [Burkholderiales bacterium]MDE2456086.1 hypothetical protein [Burkholderiales bacterium]